MAPGTKAPRDVVAVKPYCGAIVACQPSPKDVRFAGRLMPGSPMPAWADAGVGSHLQQICGVLPASPSSGGGAPEVLKPRFGCRRFALRLSVALFSVLETVACYLAFFEVRSPEKRFYNKFEAHALGTPGIDASVLVCAILHTAYLVAFCLFVGVVRLDLFFAFAVCRVPLSSASGMVCAALTFMAENTKVFPFLCALLGLLHLEVLLFEGSLQVRTEGRRWTVLRVLLVVVALVVGVVVIGWTLMFLTNGMAFLRDDDCAASRNSAMPVRVQGLAEWQCARWGEPLQIRRLPDPSEPVLAGQCSTSFRAFDKASASGVAVPSQAAHLVRCPPLCQTLKLSGPVVGCRVYDASSSICAAAVQMGVLGIDGGGTVTVIGREPPELYESCNQHGIASTANATAAANLTAWAFYFPQVQGMGNLDVVTLHGWRSGGSRSTRKPWLSYEADVSWAIGGGKTRRRQVPLGPSGDPTGAEVEVGFCRPKGASEPPACP